MIEKIDRGFAIAAIGVLLLLTGLAMPSTLTHYEEVCTKPAAGGGCWASGHHTVQVEENNDYKAPTLIGGFALSVVGVSLYRRV